MSQSQNNPSDIAQVFRKRAAAIENAWPNTRPGVCVVNYGNGTMKVDIPGEGIIDKVPCQYPRLTKFTEPGDPLIVGFLNNRRRTHFVIGAYPGVVVREEEESPGAGQGVVVFGWFSATFNGSRSYTQPGVFFDPNGPNGLQRLAMGRVPQNWEPDPDWPVTRFMSDYNEGMPLTWEYVPPLDEIDDRKFLENGDPNPDYNPVLTYMLIPATTSTAYAIDLRDPAFGQVYSGKKLLTATGEIGLSNTFGWCLFSEEGAYDVKTGLQVLSKTPVNAASPIPIQFCEGVSSSSGAQLAPPVTVEQHFAQGANFGVPYSQQHNLKLFNADYYTLHLNIDVSAAFNVAPTGGRTDGMGVMDPVCVTRQGIIVELFKRVDGYRHSPPRPDSQSGTFRLDDAKLIVAVFDTITGAVTPYVVADNVLTYFEQAVGLGNGALAVLYVVEDAMSWFRHPSGSYSPQTTRTQFLAIVGPSGVEVNLLLGTQTALSHQWSDLSLKYANYQKYHIIGSMDGNPLLGKSYTQNPYREAEGLPYIQPFVALIDSSSGAELWRDSSYTVSAANRLINVGWSSQGHARKPGGLFAQASGMVVRRHVSIDPAARAQDKNYLAVIDVHGIVGTWRDATPWLGPQQAQVITNISIPLSNVIFHGDYAYFVKRWVGPYTRPAGVADGTWEILRLRQVPEPDPPP